MLDDGLSFWKAGVGLDDELAGHAVDRRDTPIRLFFPRIQ